LELQVDNSARRWNAGLEVVEIQVEWTTEAKSSIWKDTWS
jgi:hypothetical protein